MNITIITEIVEASRKMKGMFGCNITNLLLEFDIFEKVTNKKFIFEKTSSKIQDRATNTNTLIPHF